MKKIKVVLSAIWYPLAMATYFRRAFERRKDVELFTVGPYTEAWIPWDDGMRLPIRYVKAPDYALPASAISIRLNPKMLDPTIPWHPDIWVQIDAGWHLLSKPTADIAAHVQTDPHVLKAFYAPPVSYSDLKFCMQQSYMQPGEIYLPYAFDPTIHYPMDEEKIYDACLLGLHYPNRNNLVHQLRFKGLNVKYGIGEVFDEYRLAYNRSKIALSWSSLQDIPARVFEAMGMKVPLVANIVPDMANFFVEGTDYIGFNTAEEAVDKVIYLLSKDDSRNWIAENGWRKVQKHTWDARVEQILQEAKLI